LGDVAVVRPARLAVTVWRSAVDDDATVSQNPRVIAPTARCPPRGPIDDLPVPGRTCGRATEAATHSRAAAAHHARQGGAHLFESSWKKPYSTRGVRALLARYAAKAGLTHNMPPHRLRHFLFTWPKASTTRTSSPTPGTPPEPAWRSTPGSPWPTPSSGTKPSSTSSRSDLRPLYLAAQVSNPSRGPITAATAASRVGVPISPML
jgi:hypothetical protein